jgi:hypothetical protein
MASFFILLLMRYALINYSSLTKIIINKGLWRQMKLAEYSVKLVKKTDGLSRTFG